MTSRRDFLSSLLALPAASVLPQETPIPVAAIDPSFSHGGDVAVSFLVVKDANGVSYRLPIFGELTPSEDSEPNQQWEGHAEPFWPVDNTGDQA